MAGCESDSNVTDVHTRNVITLLESAWPAAILRAEPSPRRGAAAARLGASVALSMSASTGSCPGGSSAPSSAWPTTRSTASTPPAAPS